MSRRFATIISYLFHPLLASTYAAAFLIYSNPHLFAFSRKTDQLVWMGMIFLLTFIMPVVWVILMKKLELIDSLHLIDRKERIIPYIATATFYLWTFMLFKPGAHANLFANRYLSLMMLGATFAVFIGFFVNIFAKISLHTIAAGGFIALAMIMMGISDYDLKLFLVAVVLLSGLIGTARLILEAHTEPEVLWGYAAGFIGQYIAFFIVPRFF